MGIIGLRESHHSGHLPQDGHLVQFYENDRFLASSLAEFIMMGLGLDESVAVLATRAHWEASLECISRKFGPDSSARALRCGQLLFLDADALLLKVCPNGPDRSAFEAAVEPLLRQPKWGRVRIYGELVNLLCERGRPEDAITLEGYWNTVLQRNPHAQLMCGYSMKNLDQKRVESVCSVHSHVIPADKLEALSAEEDTLQEIASLKVKAAAYESECAERKKLESELAQMASEIHKSSQLSLLGELCARLAHELNNPLAIIRGSSELAGRDLEKISRSTGAHDETIAKLAKHLAHIDTATARMAGFVKGVLDFSHQSASKRKVFNLVPHLEEAIANFHASSDSQGIKLSLDAQDPEVFCLGDPDLIQLVWKSVLSNSRDAIRESSAAGGGTINIKVTQSLGAGPSVSFTDNGSGVREKDIAKVFYPFFTTKGPGRGTGLGLSVSHGIIRQHKGDISLESTYGSGATVNVSLPPIYVFR